MKHQEAKGAKTHEEILGKGRGDEESGRQGDVRREARRVSLPVLNVRGAVRSLIVWYDGAKRAMPWRGTRDAYAIWVSEAMLQQTQVATVVPYYLRFLEKFPTVAALAAAELSEVLALWAGLGYYRRAKHLHAGARHVAERHGGRVPGTFEALLALPGIGRYTAGAIGSIAFGLPTPVVDGNVMRVLSRVYGYAEDIAVPRHQAFFWEKAQAWVNEAPRYGGCAKSLPRFGDVNQAVMELGATVCVPVSPKCGECPLGAVCVARREGRQGELPVKAAKKAVPVVRLRVWVMVRERARGRQEVLLMQRPAGGLWEHMWEFPTEISSSAKGKTEPVASGRVKRSGAVTAFGLLLGDTKRCGTVRHQLTHRMMAYEVLLARCAISDPPKDGTTNLKGGTPNLPPCDNGVNYETARWVPWPLSAGNGLAMAKVVEKIAAAVAGNWRE